MATVNKKAAVARDAYDAFLERAETAERAARARRAATGGKKAAGGGKGAGAGKRTASGPAAKRGAGKAASRPTKVREGIVPLSDGAPAGAKSGAGRGQSAKGGAPVKSGKKSAPAGRRPAAGRDGAARSRKARVAANPLADPALRATRATGDGLFLERSPRPAAKAPAPRAQGRKSGSGRAKGSGGTPPRKPTGARFGGLDAFFTAGIACLLALGFWQVSQHAHFMTMKQVVESQSFYDGTTVEGVDVSAMTLNDAMAYWEGTVEPRYADRAVTLEDGARVTARELGYSSDYASVLSSAWSAGRSGSLEERYRAATERRSSPVAYSVSRVPYTGEAVGAYVQALAAQVDRPAKDAAIASFDSKTFKFKFSDAETGSKLDEAALERDITQALDAGGGAVKPVVNIIEPKLTKKQVASRYGLVAYAITNASSSSRSRLNNIKLAMSLINGYRLQPGETFSFNEAVGKRTTGRGFQKATAFSGGEVTEQVGGGICQVSTTLFNAAVKADLEIVERHNHSLTVAYVDKGKDATVDWGNQDLRFKNNSDDDVYVCCYLTDDKRVRFGIFGKLLENGESITVEAVTTETIKHETEYQATPLLAPGETTVLQTGRDGYVAEAYKVRWDANGKQISRELLCRSRYQMKNEIIQYGA